MITASRGSADRHQEVADGPEALSRDEDLLHASQSAHYHCTSQAIRFPDPGPGGAGLDEEQRTLAQRWFDSGGLDPKPIQVTTRNRQGRALRVRSEWDGVQLHLDVCPTEAPRMGAREALRASARHYRARWSVGPKLTVLLVVIFAIVTIVGLAASGVL